MSRELFLYTGRNCGALREFLGEPSEPDPCHCDGNEDYFIPSEVCDLAPEGGWWAQPGDCIEKHRDGHFLPAKEGS